MQNYEIVKAAFAERIKERRKTDRLLSHLRYDDFRRMGYLRPITVRLPVTTLAKLELLEQKLEEEGGKVWDSRQETIFEMIESCIGDYIEGVEASSRVHEEFQTKARRAMQLNPPSRETDEKAEGDVKD
jgi:hypothetical protein